MSDTGNPDGGQQNPYGGQPIPPAGPYGYAAAAPAYDYSHWIKRVGAYVLDSIFISLTAIPAYALFFIGLERRGRDLRQR